MLVSECTPHKFPASHLNYVLPGGVVLWGQSTVLQRECGVRTVAECGMCAGAEFLARTQRWRSRDWVTGFCEESSLLRTY